MLAKVNPQLADLAISSQEFEFGIFYGRQVEFEYEVTLGSAAEGRVSPDVLEQSSLGSGRKDLLLPTPNTAGRANTLHEIFKISTSRFEAWLAGIERPKFD